MIYPGPGFIRGLIFRLIVVLIFIEFIASTEYKYIQRVATHFRFVHIILSKGFSKLFYALFRVYLSDGILTILLTKIKLVKIFEIISINK